ELVVVVGEDGDALGGKWREPAGMIEVRMRIDDVPDSFVRKQPPGFGEDRQASRFALRAFEHDHVVAELDGHGDVSADDAVHAVGELFRSHSRWRRRAAGRTASTCRRWTSSTCRGWRGQQLGEV